MRRASRAALLVALVALAACGADGAPERPGGTALSVSGTVEFGIEGGSR